MTGYASDKQLIERLLIPVMMQAVLIGMQKLLENDGPVLDPVKALLTESIKEAVADISADRAQKILRRAKRSSTQALAILGGKLMGVQYLSIARLTADLAERDVIAVGAESAFSRAWDMMSEVIGLGWDKLETLDGEAIAAADEMGRILDGLGFYRA